jgi:hypothetical protein
MKVLTISGYARSGKDSFGKMLKDLLENKGKKVLVVHYADYLKFVCKTYFGWDGEKDQAGRTLLQEVGTDIVRARNENFWVTIIAELIKVFEPDYDYFIIPDCRFPSEINLLHDAYEFDLKTIWVARFDKNYNPYDNGLTEEQKAHPSESSLNEWEFDFYVNGVDLKDLQEVAINLVEDLENGTFDEDE